MTSPLLPIGGAVLGSFAVSALRELNPGKFLRELCGGGKAESTEQASASENPSDALPAVEVDLSQALPNLIRQLRLRLTGVGADLQQPIVLKDDGRGGVMVDGVHPDRVAIEELFASDPQLCADFQTVAGAASTERAELARLLDEPEGEFRLHLDDETAAIHFE